MKQKEDKNNKTDAVVEVAPYSRLSQDLKNSVLIVSVFVNLVIFTAWIALQVTSRYDAQMASFLFG